MIIPVRCFTCGNVICSKYLAYKDKVVAYRAEKDVEPLITNDISKLLDNETPECKALNDVGLTRPCCRTRFITHVDII